MTPRGRSQLLFLLLSRLYSAQSVPQERQCPVVIRTERWGRCSLCVTVNSAVVRQHGVLVAGDERLVAHAEVTADAEARWLQSRELLVDGEV